MVAGLAKAGWPSTRQDHWLYPIERYEPTHTQYTAAYGSMIIKRNRDNNQYLSDNHEMIWYV